MLFLCMYVMGKKLRLELMVIAMGRQISETKDLEILSNGVVIHIYIP